LIISGIFFVAYIYTYKWGIKDQLIFQVE